MAQPSNLMEVIERMLAIEVFSNVQVCALGFLLREAASRGDIAVLQKVLASNKKEVQIAINIKDLDGNTPLLLAVANNQLPVVSLLMNTNKVDVRLCNNYEIDATLMALITRNSCCLQMMLEHPVLAQLDSIVEEKALLFAIEQDNMHPFFIELLLNSNKGYQALAVDEYKRTPLMLACHKGNTEAVQLILRHVSSAAILGHRDIFGNNVLALAAQGGHSQCVKLLLNTLLQLDNLINTANHKGDHALLLAARNNHAEVVNILLEHGANEWHTNLQGESLASFMPEGGQLEAQVKPIIARYQKLTNTPTVLIKSPSNPNCKLH